MSQRSGTFLLGLVLTGLGVIYCAYPPVVLLKTITYYSSFAPLIASLKVNVVLGLVLLLTSTALFIGKSHSSFLLIGIILLAIAFEGNPYVPTLDSLEKTAAIASLLKYIGVVGIGLLIK
jgi:hypothetical protein